MEERSKRTEITADMVLKRWWEITSADPNELIQLRRCCCRFCHGADHQYQWTERQFRAAVLRAKADETDEPDCAGGFGFNPTLDPHPDCPECHGEGDPHVHVNDTRKLGGKAKLLYAGLKQTREGIEIKMRDQDKALENVARHLGMFVDKTELTGKDGKDLVPELDSKELARRLAYLLTAASKDSGTPG